MVLFRTESGASQMIFLTFRDTDNIFDDVLYCICPFI